VDLLLLPMLALAGVSAFFSASEAALFSLNPAQRRELEHGTGARRRVGELLRNPDQVLSAILFCNLLTNNCYFALASMISLRLDREGATQQAYLLSLGAVLFLILVGEMFPKSLGVSLNRRLAPLVVWPLMMSVRGVRYIMPLFRVVSLLSLRLIWPNFRAESEVSVDDLDRAVQRSTTDATLREHEQRILQHILEMSTLRVDALMRPRNQISAHRPPVALRDVTSELEDNLYVYVTEPDSEEVAAALAWRSVGPLPAVRLDALAEPVLYVPWCATAAQALQDLRDQKRRVAAIINEFGETLGVLTFEDLLDTIIGESPSRSARLWKEHPIRQAGPGVWHVNGLAELRRLEKQFGWEETTERSTTLAGWLQELLGRFPQQGDRCEWHDMTLTVLESFPRGRLVVELRQHNPEARES